MDILDVFHQKLFEFSEAPLTSLPKISIGGVGNWRHAVGAAIGIKNAGNQQILCFCILDRDYKSQAEIEKIEKKSAEHGLNSHFWKKKK